MAIKGKTNNKSKIGRNDPCPCGSGKKYKKCCLAKDKEIKKVSQLKNDSKDIRNSKITDNPSIQEMKGQIEIMKAFKAANDNGLLKNFDFDFKEINKILPEAEEMVYMLDKFNEYFSKVGWITYMSMNRHVTKKVVKLAENNQFNAAEQVLIDYYSENIELFIQWVDWMEEFKPRMELIKKAYDDYLNERYHACIPILLAVIDGVVFDNKETGNKGFFGEENKLTADDAIAAHITGLPALQKLMSSPRTKTTTEEITIPYRNGIIHGRDLDYANKIVATKLWATLFALKDGLIEIKKSKEPKEESDEIDFIKTMELVKKNEIRENLSKEWKNLELKANIDFPETGNSSDYEDEKPEKALVEFFEDWKANKFGKIAQKIDHVNFTEYTLNDLAGKLRRKVFNKKKLNSFKILKIIDKGPAISEITVELVIEKEEELITKEITFRMIYENDDGEIEIRTMNNGSWKFISCFSEIENI